MEPLVIVGTGLGGYSLARELRKRDADTPLVLLTADDGASYSKPMLSGALGKGQDADDLVLADAETMAVRLNADIRTHTRVTALDPARHCLRTGTGDLHYGRLVLALGADPIRPPLAGNRADGVLSINDRGDYARFRAALAPDTRVAILGAGLIGCEFANDLRRAGIEVHLIDPAPTVLSRLLPLHAATALQRGLESIGVQVHLDRCVSTADRHGAGVRLTLDAGPVVDADLVLSAVGLRPRITLAASAGLQVERGIVTDRYLRTSDEHIYALGDCAEVQGLSLPFVMPLMASARALGATLGGEPTPVRYPAMPVIVKTPDCPTVVCPPPPGIAGHWHEQQDGTGVRAWFRDPQNRLRGFALVGSGAVADKQRLSAQLESWLA